MVQTKATVLIVEDDENLSKALQVKFSSDNYTVLVAKDGEEGLATALEKHPDIILLDVIMPKMDGMTMIGQLRKDPWGEKVPVIMLTNVSPDGDAQLSDVITNKPSYYLIKSNTKMDDIAQKVHELLSAEQPN